MSILITMMRYDIVYLSDILYKKYLLYRNGTWCLMKIVVKEVLPSSILILNGQSNGNPVLIMLKYPMNPTVNGTVV